MAYVAKHRSTSTDPAVRTAVALVACSEIGFFIVHVGIVVGGVLGHVIRPKFVWLRFVGAATSAALAAVSRLWRTCIQLRLVNTGSTSE